jgi:hypothetical protein
MTSIRTLSRRLIAGSALLLVAAPAVAMTSTAAATAAATAAVAQPAPGTCPAVVVRSAEIVRTVYGPGILVRGVKPHADTKVLLEAEDVVYIRQPDYWNYFAVGCGGTGPVVKTPFTQVFPVPTGPTGRFGITVNGIPINIGDDAAAVA